MSTETQGTVTDETKLQQQNNSPGEMGAEQETLQQIRPETIKEMKTNELRTLCKTEGQPASGGREELIERLLIKKLGRDDRFVQSSTRCKICGARVKALKTTKQPLKDNRTLLTRQVKCEGKHKHTYPLEEIV